MSRFESSLIAGRRVAPLTPEEVLRVTRTFYYFDRDVNAIHDPAGRTRFRVRTVDGVETGEILFGSDIMPGQGVDANSALSLTAAVAHELTHYYRWRNDQELPVGVDENLDEALTSLQAVQRYWEKLEPSDQRLLVADAMLRIALHRAHP